MKRLVVASFVLALPVALSGCASGPAKAPESLVRADGVQVAAVGGSMVNDRTTMVTVTSLVPKPRVDGLRTDFVYLGLLGTDPAGRNVARVRYEEHLTQDGVESERVEYRAVIELDLARGDVLSFKGWRIRVLEATDASIRYEVIGVPAR